MESEVNQGPGFSTHWGNIFYLNFLFPWSKASDANIGIIANFRICSKPLLEPERPINDKKLLRTCSLYSYRIAHLNKTSHMWLVTQ